MTTPTIDQRCGQCHQRPCAGRPGCLIYNNILQNDADEADDTMLQAGLQPGESLSSIKDLQLTHDGNGGRIGHSVPYFRARVESIAPIKKKRVQNADREYVILKLVDESLVPLRAIAFGEQARSLADVIANGSQTDFVFRGGKLEPLDAKYRKGIYSGVERSLVLQSHSTITVSDVPVDLPDPVEDGTQSTSKSNRVNFKQHLEEIDQRWAAKFDGQTLKDVILNVEGGFGKPPTTYCCVNGVWGCGPDAFCALLSKVASEDANSSVHKDLLEGIKTYGINHDFPLVSFMSTDQWAQRNNDYPEGWYPFSDGLMNICNLTAREWRPFEPSDYITECGDVPMPSEEQWLSLSRPGCMESLRVKDALKKVLPEPRLRREVMWRIAAYLMDPDKSLMKQHLNVIGHKNNGKTFIALLIRTAFGKVWVGDVEMEHLQVGHTFDPSKAQPWLVALFMRRLVFGEEGGKDVKGRIRPLSSRMIKQTAGGSLIKARLMGENDLPAVRPTWAYCFMSNSSVAVQGEEHSNGHAEQERMVRFRAPAVFMTAAELEEYENDPDSLDAKFYRQYVQQRRPDKVQQILEGGPMYRYATMHYVAMFYNEYKERMAWTDAWMKEDPAAEERYLGLMEEWEEGGQVGPRPSQPRSKAWLWRKLSPEEQADAEAGNNPEFDFRAMSNGQATTYASFRKLLCPISESLDSPHELTGNSAPEIPPLRWLLDCLFEYTNDTHERNCKLVYLSEMLEKVHNNKIFNDAYKRITVDDILAEFSQDIESDKVVVAKKKRVGPAGASGSKSTKNAKAVCGVKFRDEYVMWEAGTGVEWATPNAYCTHIGHPNPFVAAMERVAAEAEEEERAEAEAARREREEQQRASEAARKAREAERVRRERESMLNGDGCKEFLQKHSEPWNLSHSESLRTSMTAAFREKRLEKGGSIPLQRLVYLLYEARGGEYGPDLRGPCLLPKQARFRKDDDELGPGMKVRWAEALVDHYRDKILGALCFCTELETGYELSDTVSGISECAGPSGIPLEDGTSAADRTPEAPPSRGTRSHSASSKRSGDGVAENDATPVRRRLV